MSTVINGDVGFVLDFDQEEVELTITFDGWRVVHDFGDLDYVVLVYATTIHKAQGSECLAVGILVERRRR
ncbi:MAG: hypothetical protein ACR2P3_14915 [Geminicoccaceae bacterium]